MDEAMSKCYVQSFQLQTTYFSSITIMELFRFILFLIEVSRRISVLLINQKAFPGTSSKLIFQVINFVVFEMLEKV